MCHFTWHLQRQEAATQARQRWSLTHYRPYKIYFRVSLLRSEFEADRWTHGGGGGKFNLSTFNDKEPGGSARPEQTSAPFPALTGKAMSMH